MWLLTGPLTISITNFILGLHWDWEKHSGKEQDVQRTFFVKSHFCIPQCEEVQLMDNSQKRNYN